ncbi:MAG: outer membrane protein assembly factor BamD, partial [Bdellovibrionales bacterium]|nr:outer membrane protein assembly factor BamD [Bdellovibrionales bacterium]
MSVGISFPLMLVGCSGSKSEPEPELVEISDESVLTLDTPEVILFDRAKRLYESNLYRNALEAFELLRDGYPFGAYSDFADIKIADCQFQMKEYATAALLYEDFLKEHPRSENAPYALLRAARSYQLSNRGSGRDIGPLEKSLELYEKLLHDYPQSVYFESGKQWKRETINSLIESELLIIDFYTRRGKPVAAEARQKSLEARWGQTKIQQAKKSLEDSEPPAIAPLELVNAKRVAEDLSPPSLLALDGRETNMDLQVQTITDHQEEPKITHSTLEQAELEILQSADRFSNRITKVECNSDKKLAFIFLDKSIEDISFLTAHEVLNPTKAGDIELKIPDTGSVFEEFSCFQEKDLRFSSDGVIKIKSSGPAEMLLIENPPRLLL